MGLMVGMLPILLVWAVSVLGAPLSTPPLAPTFSLTVSEGGHSITLHYPSREDVGEWREVCVWQRGETPAEWDPEYKEGWERLSCWRPYWGLEQLILSRGTFMVEGFLFTVKGGVETRWVTPPTNTRVTKVE